MKIHTNRTHAGGCRGPQPDCRAGVRRAWAAVPNADARLRAQQAAEHAARHVPGALLRHAVPLPEQAVRRGPDRQGRRRARRAPRVPGALGSPRPAAERPTAGQVEDRLPADRRGQGAVAGPARRLRPRRLGGRRVRRSLRVLRPDQGGHPAADPGGQAQPPGGPDGRGAGGTRAHQGAGGQLHARTAAARARVRGARGAVAQRADRLGTAVGTVGSEQPRQRTLPAGGS